MAKIGKQAQQLIDAQKIDVSKIVGTGKNGLIKLVDVRKYISNQTHEAKVIKDDKLAVVKDETGKAPVNTHLKFYQLTVSKNNGTYESWNYHFDFVKTGEVDMNRLAKFVAKTLFNMTDVLVRRGMKSSFSPSKPLWFEMNNGAEKVTLNLTMATQFKLFLKAKKGQNVRTQAEMINDIEGIFEMNNAVVSAEI